MAYTGAAAIDTLQGYRALNFRYRKLHLVSISPEEDSHQALPAVNEIASSVTGLDAERTAALTMIAADSAETAQIDSAFIETLGELDRYADYPNRWDGYLAEPFKPEVLSRARSILRMARRTLLAEQVVPSLMTTGPASDGSLDVEIRESNRTLFYTIYPEVDVEVSAIADGRAPIRGKIPFNETALAQWLDWVVGKGSLPKTMENNQLHPR